MGKRLDWLRPTRLVSICFLVLLCPVFGSARSSLGSSTAIKNQEPATIKANSALVLVDVLVQDKRNGDAIAGLGVTDFVVRDSGKSITVLEANRGLDEHLRPIQLWFLAMCNVSVREPKLPVKRESGSASVAGNNDLLRPALSALRSDETVGVARWCGNSAEIILQPTVDREEPLAAIERIVAAKPASVSDLAGERGRRKALQLIDEQVDSVFPQPLPAVVFLTPSAESSRSMSFSLAFWGTTDAAHASALGDDVGFSGQQDQFAKRLATVVDVLHKRYQLAFQPSAHDASSHHLQVELTRDARKSFPTAFVSYRDSYTMIPSPSAASSRHYQAALDNMDTNVRTALTGSAEIDQVHFQFSRTPADAAGSTKFVIRLDPSSVTWTTLPNRDRRVVVMEVVAALSAKNRPVGLVVKKLEIVQEKERLQSIARSPVTLTTSSTLPRETARVRVLVRDMVSGRIGTRDLIAKP
jgi:hypothetical protein